MYTHEHQIVELETLYDSYGAEIFSVYLTTTDFDYIQTDFSSKEDYANHNRICNCFLYVRHVHIYYGLSTKP